MPKLYKNDIAAEYPTSQHVNRSLGMPKNLSQYGKPGVTATFKGFLHPPLENYF